MDVLREYGTAAESQDSQKRHESAECLLEVYPDLLPPLLPHGNLPRAVQFRARFLIGNTPVGHYSDVVSVITIP